MYQHLRQVWIHKNSDSFPFFQGTDPLLECMCPQVHDWPVRSMPVSWVWYKSSTVLACSYYVNFSNFTNTSGESWQTMTLVWQMNDNVFHFCSESSCHLRRFSLAISFGSLLSCVRFGDAHRKMPGFLIFLFLLLLHKPHLSSFHIFSLWLLLFQAFKRFVAIFQPPLKLGANHFHHISIHFQPSISGVAGKLLGQAVFLTPALPGFLDFQHLAPVHHPCLGKDGMTIGIDVFRMKNVLVVFYCIPCIPCWMWCWMISRIERCEATPSTVLWCREHALWCWFIEADQSAH